MKIIAIATAASLSASAATYTVNDPILGVGAITASVGFSSSSAWYWPLPPSLSLWASAFSAAGTFPNGSPWIQGSIFTVENIGLDGYHEQLLLDIGGSAFSGSENMYFMNPYHTTSFTDVLITTASTASDYGQFHVSNFSTDMSPVQYMFDRVGAPSDMSNSRTTSFLAATPDGPVTCVFALLLMLGFRLYGRKA